MHQEITSFLLKHVSQSTWSTAAGVFLVFSRRAQAPWDRDATSFTLVQREGNCLHAAISCTRCSLPSQCSHVSNINIRTPLSGVLSLFQMPAFLECPTKVLVVHYICFLHVNALAHRGEGEHHPKRRKMERKAHSTISSCLYPAHGQYPMGSRVVPDWLYKEMFILRMRPYYSFPPQMLHKRT